MVPSAQTIVTVNPVAKPVDVPLTVMAVPHRGVVLLVDVIVIVEAANAACSGNIETPMNSRRKIEFFL